jgi:hypothetical protein
MARAYVKKAKTENFTEPDPTIIMDKDKSPIITQVVGNVLEEMIQTIENQETFVETLPSTSQSFNEQTEIFYNQPKLTDDDTSTGNNNENNIETIAINENTPVPKMLGPSKLNSNQKTEIKTTFGKKRVVLKLGISLAAIVIVQFFTNGKYMKTMVGKYIENEKYLKGALIGIGIAVSILISWAVFTYM